MVGWVGDWLGTGPGLVMEHWQMADDGPDKSAGFPQV